MTTTASRQGDLTQPPPPLPYDIASWLIAGVALFLVLPLHLLPALLAGVSVYELVQFLGRALKIVRIHDQHRKLAAVAIVAARAFGAFSFLDEGSASTSSAH